MLSAPKLDKIEIAPRTLPGHKLCRSEAVKEFRQAVHGRVPATTSTHPLAWPRGAFGPMAIICRPLAIIGLLLKDILVCFPVLRLSEANQDEFGATLDAQGTKEKWLEAKWLRERVMIDQDMVQDFVHQQYETESFQFQYEGGTRNAATRKKPNIS